MAVRERERPNAYVAIACPACGLVRSVSARHSRRIRSGLSSAHCRRCARGGAPDAPSQESMRRWWLRAFGAHLNGCTSAEYVQAHGLPPELEELLRRLLGPRRTWARFRRELDYERIDLQ